jgi:glycosyltransferase involved in cell wall biosynthesis
MKILFANWSWYATGGDWTYIQNLRKLYESNGYEVIPFSTKNLKNEGTAYAHYFVKSYDYNELNKQKNLKNGIRVLKTSIVAKDAINKLDKLLSDNSDIKIAHLHNIHHYITPSIIWLLKKRGIKIIWTLHDFKIICPENSFVSNGKVCEKCITGDFYHCALNVCKKKSFLASALAATEAYYYHKKHIYDLVDYYLCPSKFLLNKFLQFGFKESKMLVTNSCYDISEIDNFISNYLAASEGIKKEKYVLYIGRLEEIKGIHILIEAVKDTNIKLKIAGTGLLEGKLKKMAAGFNNIEFLGFKKKQEVYKLIVGASFVICPSICYENLPFSVIESFLFSKPVIGSEIGGIPELVIDGKTGLLFEPGNFAHLCEKINHLWNNEDIVNEFGKAARVHAYNMVNYISHWNILQPVLQKISG